MAATRAVGAWLMARAYAHRGLHGPGVPENSLAAAHTAIAAGHCIECDVRLSRDGIVHVFHDIRLERLTGAHGRFGDRDSADIARLRLSGGVDAAIPTLAALLEAITCSCEGRRMGGSLPPWAPAFAGARREAIQSVPTPLLIEIKSDSGPMACARLCAAVAALLDRHDGPAAVMSFDPLVPRWFARHRPGIARGLVISRRLRAGIVARRGEAGALARSAAQFVACDVRDLPRAAALPRRTGRPLLSWTVRTPAAWARIARHRAQAIFEGAAP